MSIENRREALEGIGIGDYRSSGTLSQSGKVVFLTGVTLSMDINDQVVKVTTTSDADNTAITLPSVRAAVGRIYSIYFDTLGDDESVVISDLGDDAGLSDITLDAADEYSILYSDGYRWYEIASNHS